MKAVFSDAGTLGGNRAVTLHERYFRVMQIVATCWTLIGAATMAFWLNVPRNSESYVKMKFLTGGCFFVAAGIMSLLFPMYYVAKRHSSDTDRD